jgi:hypothetical protein
MKRFVPALIFVVLLCVACQQSEAPVEDVEQPATETEEPAVEPGRATVEATVGGAQVSVNYGQPELKGRDMLGMLEDGQVWRLGMNEATVFATDQDLAIGDAVLKAGKYSIWAKKISVEEWHLIFNSEADIWGTQRKAENDVAEVAAEVTELEESAERLLIRVVSTGDQNGEIVVKWATLQIKVPFSVSAPEGSGS